MPASEKKPTPCNTASKAQDWYLKKGWKVLNELLVEFPNQDRIWVENFDEVSRELSSSKRETLLRRFNADAVGWRMKKDSDGVLYAERV